MEKKTSERNIQTAKVTVVIPVYNTSRYLSKCVDSVIKQDYKNLEIILVNDASKDNSLQICEKLAKKDFRIKIINKEFNEGLELARRAGLSIASGKYILYVDSDDWLGRRDTISLMCQKAEETGADYVEIKAYRTIDKFGLFKKKITNKNIYGLIEQPELFDKYFLSFLGRIFLSVTIWGKLYRKSVLDRAEIKPLGVKMGEDLGYNIQLFPHLKKIFIMPEVGYFYRYGGMTSKFNPHLLPDLKKIFIFKDKMIKEYNYEKGVNSSRHELKNILKSEIRQRIRYGESRYETISFLEKEITDPIYESFKDIDPFTSFWKEAFVIGFVSKDTHAMYDECVKEENKDKWKRSVIKLVSKIIGT